MDELIEELKEAGTFTPDEMRWAECLRQQEQEAKERRKQELERLNAEYMANLTWREKYELYLLSEKWQQIRGIAIYVARNKCARCGWKSPTYDGKGLEVHHKTYKHLGNEPLEDLEVLCPTCHKVADQERAAKNKGRQHK